jgi:hypothetical protein
MTSLHSRVPHRNDYPDKRPILRFRKIHALGLDEIVALWNMFVGMGICRRRRRSALAFALQTTRN